MFIATSSFKMYHHRPKIKVKNMSKVIINNMSFQVGSRNLNW
jgi:hypothetical protein